MKKELSGFQRLLDIVKQLRDPLHGCPWDLQQTHQSLRPHVIEEAYEVVEAIDKGDSEHLKEELGDLLLQVALHSQLAAESGAFTIDEVAEGIAEKLIRRHPHVFGELKVSGADEVLVNWENIKAFEKSEKSGESVMDDLPVGVPALSKALEVSKRAVKEGFEWPNFDSLWKCVMSEYEEFRHELEKRSSLDKLEEELGDILFATVNLARYNGIHPELALNGATNKFIRRYKIMEQISDKPIREQSFEVLDLLWNKAKKHAYLSERPSEKCSGQDDNEEKALSHEEFIGK